MDICVEHVAFDEKPVSQKISELLQLANSLESTAKGLQLVPMENLQATAQRIADCKRRAHTYRVIARRLELLAQQDITSSFQELEAAVAA